MANKIPSKGSNLQMEISSVYTSIPQLLSISVSGEKSTTYPSTTLDGPVHETRDPTGYATPADISAEVLYDPDDSTHAAFIALIAAPVETNFKVLYADSTPHEDIYACTGFGIDRTVSPQDGLKATLSMESSGTPS